MRGLALVMSSVSAALATEVIMGDLYVGVQTGPAKTSMTVDNGTRSDTVGADPLWSVGLRAGGRTKMFSRPGASMAPIIGAELVVNQASYDHGSTDTRMGLAVTPGLVWSCSDRTSLLLQGVIGVGRERLQLGETASNTTQTLTGNYQYLGVRGGLTYSLSASYLLGFEVEWATSPSSVSGDGLALTVTPHGVSGGLVLLWRLNPYPTSLE